MYVEFIFPLLVLDVFFEFAEIRRKCGPPLRVGSGPDEDLARLEASSGDERARRVPLCVVLVEQ